MPKPLKLRRANEIIGLFIILSLAVAVTAVFMGPRTQRWFTPARTIVIHLPPEGSLGLRKGADVLILGSVVGSVEDITVDDAGEMEAEVSIRGNFIRFVRVDSVAVIRKPLGIGDATIEISRGHGEPLPVTGAALNSTADKAPTEMMQETLSAIREEALPAIKDLRGAISEYTRLAVDLRGQQGEIKEAMQHLNRVGDSLEHGNGIAGILLNDSKAAAEARAILPRINASLDSLQATLENSRHVSERLPETVADANALIKSLRATSDDLGKSTARLPELEKSAQGAADKVPDLILQLEETARQVQRLTEALQHNWLIRGDMDRSPRQTRIDGDRVGAGR